MSKEAQAILIIAGIVICSGILGWLFFITTTPKRKK